MEDLDLSSCSFLSDNFEMDNSKQELQAENKNLTLQNERLTEVNSQLKTSLSTLKNQLKDALEAVNSTNGFTEQIQQLKQQLNDSAELNAKLQEEVRAMNQNGSVEAEKLNAKLQQATQERDRALNSLKQAQEQRNKMKSERAAMKENIEEQNAVVENLLQENDRLKANKKKQRAKMNELNGQIGKLEEAIEIINNDLQKEKSEKSAVEQELQSAREQISSLEKDIEEQKAQNEAAQKTIEEKCNGYALFEEQIEQQREELDLASQERQRIITILHKMSSALLLSETKLEDLTKENTVLNAKVQKQNKVSTLFSKSDISDIAIPYQGDLSEDCKKFLKLPQYQPVQRIQLIINESAKYIVEKEEEVNELKQIADEANEKYEAAEETAQKVVQTLDALLKDLKELAINEQNIQKVSTCNNDTQFMTFLADKCAQLEPTIREKVLADPHFISNDFFFSDDIEKRKKEIQSISEQNDTTFAILAAQFITNVILNHQIEALKTPTVASREISEQPSEEVTPVKEEVQKSASNSVISVQNEEVNQNLYEKYTKVVKVAKQMKAALKKSQQTQMEIQKADSDQKAQISQLQIQCEDYKNEIDVISIKLQVANNKLAAKSAEEIVVPKAPEVQIQVEPINTALEEELKQKKEECSKLNTQLRKAQGEYEKSLLSKSKQYKKSENNLKKEIETLGEQMEAIIEQTQMKKKEQKKKDKIRNAQFEKKIKEMNDEFDDIKIGLNSTIEQLNGKVEKANQESQKLVEEVSEANKKNEEIQQENETLVANVKRLQVEVNQMKQQINKEKQHLQGQLSAQNMVYETKLQQALKEAREKAESEYEGLLQIAHQSLGTIYDIDDNDFTEETFKQLIQLVKSDLDKLKYFQTEATKFTLDKKKEE